MKKILLISHNQFGYQTDFYKYAQYLKSDFKVSYFCFDYGRKKVIEKGIRIIYQAKEGPRVKQLGNFLYNLKKHFESNSYDLIILKHFPLVGIIQFFTKDKILLAIQTGGVTRNKTFNYIFNLILRLDSKIFKYFI